MRIFLPTRLACSITRTRRPRRPAVKPHINPAAPPPMMTTSRLSGIAPTPGGIRRQARLWINADHRVALENLYMAILDQALQAQAALGQRGERIDGFDRNVEHGQVLRTAQLVGGLFPPDVTTTPAVIDQHDQPGAAAGLAHAGGIRMAQVDPQANVAIHFPAPEIRF